MTNVAHGSIPILHSTHIFMLSRLLLQGQGYSAAAAVGGSQCLHSSALAAAMDSEKQRPLSLSPQSPLHRKYHSDSSYRQSQFSAGLYTLRAGFGKSHLLSPPHLLPTAAYLHSSAHTCLPDKKLKHVLEAKPTVEKAVDTLKEKKKKVDSPTPPAPLAPGKEGEEPRKPSLARRAWEVVVHYYHGFRLLLLDTRVAVRLLWKTMWGNTLTRREQKQVGGAT